MKKLGLGLFIGWLIFFSAGAQAAPVSITVAPAAEISAAVVYLGDIAQISGEDPLQAADLRAIVVGKIPLPGNTMEISSQVFALRMNASGVDCSEVTWDVPAAISVHRLSQTIAASEFEQLARQKITEQLRDGGELRRYTIETLTVPQKLNLPQGEVTYELTVPSGIKPGLPTSVFLAVLVDGEIYKKVVCRVRVHIYENVLVAARPLVRQQVVAAGDLRFQPKEINAYSGRCLTGLKDAVGFIMARNISAGTVLLKNMVVKPIIMQQGMPVHLLVSFHGVRVQTDGLALQSGREGDRIRVRNAASKKILYGEIIDSNTVEISE